MKYLTGEQIILIHSIVIDETGGSHGIREHDIILSLENTPRQHVFGKELYPTIFLKAAVYTRHIIFYHPFLDGNKRSGMASASVFLENKGWKIFVKEGEIKTFALNIVAEKMEIEKIAAWFKKHSKKL